MPTILVTGATGQTGREVLRSLRDHRAASQRPLTLRAASRSGSSAHGPDVEAVQLDFKAPETFGKAVAECDGVFLLRPPAIADTRATLVPFIDAARQAGARQVVFLSVAGAERNPIVPHHAVEQHLQAGPPGWTILRPGFFAQNLVSAYRPDIVEDNRIYVPAGGGRVAFVDLRDVGAVAASALLHLDAHQGNAYTLTGPEAFSFHAVARILTEATRRPIRYDPASILGYVWHLWHRRSLSLGQTVVQTILHVGLRLGQAATPDPTLEHLLGHRPYDVREYIRDHASLWTKSSPSRRA